MRSIKYIHKYILKGDTHTQVSTTSNQRCMRVSSKAMAFVPHTHADHKSHCHMAHVMRCVVCHHCRSRLRTHHNTGKLLHQHPLECQRSTAATRSVLMSTPATSLQLKQHGSYSGSLSIANTHPSHACRSTYQVGTNSSTTTPSQAWCSCISAAPGADGNPIQAFIRAPKSALPDVSPTAIALMLH